MGLENFFGEEEDKPKKENLPKDDNQEITHDVTKDPIQTQSPEQSKKSVLEPLNPTQFIEGQDLDNLFLLDVYYHSDLGKAQAMFYHEPTRSIYKWTDTSDHKPYLLTMLSKESIEKIPQVVNSRDFVKIEEVERFLPIEAKSIKLNKVYGTNPLAIGGTKTSFREFIDPSYEADIRYHFNYVTEKKITPATYYQVKDGELLPAHPALDTKVETELKTAFSMERKEQLEMLDEYMPLLFQNMPDVLRAAIDIEVDSEKGRLPNPNNPVDAIISIALVDTDDRKICWVLRRKEVNDQKVDFPDIDIRMMDDEISLLKDFFNELNNYPIILTFNGDNFDAPYIYNRAVHKFSFNRPDVPFKMKRNDVSLTNSIHIDLYKFFRQASIRIYAFGARYDNSSLDELSSALLGENKVEHSEVWINEMDLKTLVTYNVKDSELTLRLTQFDDNVVMNLMFILMRICKMPLYDFSRIAVSGWLQMWLVYEHRKRGFLIPRSRDILAAKGETAVSEAIIDGKNFQGAIVLEPQPGIWWDVRVLDFASLYPSIIKTKNLSYETIRCTHQICRSNRVPEVNHWTCTKRVGLFSIILGFVRDTRVKWFKPRASDQNIEEKERRINNTIQSSLKVLINAGYGVFGSKNFDFYCPPVAESTTAYARSAITRTQEFATNTLGVKVLYGDTDSVFLHKITEEQTEQLLEWGKQNIGIELGTDYIFRYVVFSERKKNYFGITTRGKTIVKGLMGKKKNTPGIIRDNFTKILDILKDVQTPEELEEAKEYVKRTLQRMVQRIESGNFSIPEASVKLTLTRKLKDYGTWTQTVQAIAQLMAYDMQLYGDMDIGDQIEFIKTKSPVEVYIAKNFPLSFENGVRTASVVPVQLVDETMDIDPQPLIDAAESTFSQLLNSIGLSWERVMGIQSLDDWF